ncbi:secondary thiamine-phosphate synthase enzyme YjbQ [Desulfosarcina sp.]|uniref:secondary thiamine-phosphate synthase enzyme YjbQ n=1 Tax=Desulfosarcina sp. TaxID=2027861 RepID=UPI0039707F08
MRLSVKTHAQTEMIDVTARVQQHVTDSGMTQGLCVVFVPHTTAGVTINECADPAVCQDILMVLNKIVPWKEAYRHLEGNSPAHLKTAMIGSSQTLYVEKSRLVLGTWQGIFFCEFDGPRNRKLDVRLIRA